MHTGLVLEYRYIEFCSCRVAAMVSSGNLIRIDDKLFYSERSRSLDDLHTAWEENFLIEVTDDVALDLELASAHWKVDGIVTSGVARSGAETRTREVPLLYVGAL